MSRASCWSSLARVTSKLTPVVSVIFWETGSVPHLSNQNQVMSTNSENSMGSLAPVSPPSGSVASELSSPPELVSCLELSVFEGSEEPASPPQAAKQPSSIATVSSKQMILFMFLVLSFDKIFICAPGRPGGHRYQPFTEPIMTPLTKYFCRKGYTISMGVTASTMLAICKEVVVLCMAEAA